MSEVIFVLNDSLNVLFMEKTQQVDMLKDIKKNYMSNLKDSAWGFLIWEH